ncbi:nucleotidyltransferase domain-containing protein [Salinispora arenicola]|uniref:nucleotidyltransferase domain-containing protein n=1 Tax=Salinispora arenicola TaxID=168697 RepID=UPI0003654E26|nr:nucleotidyltransferase domain-containing protein [Salinispora arenicola]
MRVTLDPVLTQARSREVRSVVDTVVEWAAERAEVRGVLVVGSWARGTARMDSDVDVVVLTGNVHYSVAGVWTGLLGGEMVRSAEWGPLREIRVRRPSGLVVEIGVTPVSWADTDPVDAGTHRVIDDGHRVVHDPAGVLARLSAACEPERRHPDLRP